MSGIFQGLRIIELAQEVGRGLPAAVREKLTDGELIRFVKTAYHVLMQAENFNYDLSTQAKKNGDKRLAALDVKVAVNGQGAFGRDCLRQSRRERRS